MAYSSITKPTDYFNTVTWTGNGTSQSITGVGFQPDFSWSKQRNVSQDHVLLDLIRGTTKQLYSSDTAAEQTNTTGVTSFDSDGFSLGSSGYYNTSGNTYVAWNWLASNTTASNTDGSITSTVSANTTAGFSIGTYTANATVGATVGHGLGVAPDMLIVKPRNANNNWAVYHKSMGETKAMYLDGTSAETTDGWLNNTAPSSSVFTLSGGNYGNASGYNVVFYAFAEKKGYSKFGSFEGNGNADGPFIYTGFKPAWVMIKDIDNSGNSWVITDNKRNPFNVADDRLFADLNNAENQPSDSGGIDFTAQGFKVRTNDGSTNQSGTRIYMTFAENPFVANNSGTAVPVTAR